MKNVEELLPVGSVVYLEGGTALLVIVGVCKLVQPKDEDKRLYFDYSATLYPQGLEEENLFYFNHENIDQVVFTGMESEEFRRYLKVVSQKMEEERGTFERGQV